MTTEDYRTCSFGGLEGLAGPCSLKAARDVASRLVVCIRDLSRVFERNVDCWFVPSLNGPSRLEAELIVLQFFTSHARDILECSCLYPGLSDMSRSEFSRVVETLELSWSGAQQEVVAPLGAELRSVTLHEGLIRWSEKVCRTMKWHEKAERLCIDSDDCIRDLGRRKRVATVMRFLLEDIDATALHNAEERLAREWSVGLQFLGTHCSLTLTSLKSLPPELGVENNGPSTPGSWRHGGRAYPASGNPMQMSAWDLAAALYDAPNRSMHLDRLAEAVDEDGVLEWDAARQRAARATRWFRKQSIPMMVTTKKPHLMLIEVR